MLPLATQAFSIEMGVNLLWSLSKEATVHGQHLPSNATKPCSLFAKLQPSTST